MNLNENIKNFRTFRGITQSEIAARLNKSKGVISNWERGDNSPNPDEIEKLCRILNVSPNQIFGWEEVPEYEEYVAQMRAHMDKIIGLKRKQQNLKEQIDEVMKQIAEERKKLQNMDSE